MAANSSALCGQLFGQQRFLNHQAFARIVGALGDVAIINSEGAAAFGG